ncbi:MAG: hypothetical protein AAI946_00870 [Candidatus Hodgkinia cicadicola]
MRSQIVCENKARLGTERACCVVGLVLTGEQVSLIRRAKPRLSACRVSVVNNELWVLGLTQCKVKALLTRAQIADMVDKTARFGAKLVIKNVLSSGYALIKATMIACNPEAWRANTKAHMRAKKLALMHQQISSATGACIG